MMKTYVIIVSMLIPQDIMNHAFPAGKLTNIIKFINHENQNNPSAHLPELVFAHKGNQLHKIADQKIYFNYKLLR